MKTRPPSEPLAEETSEERKRAAAMFSRPTLDGVAAAGRTWVLRVGNCLIAIRDQTNEEPIQKAV